MGKDGSFSYTYTPRDDEVAVGILDLDGANDATDAISIAGRAPVVENQWFPPYVLNQTPFWLVVLLRAWRQPRYQR